MSQSERHAATLGLAALRRIQWRLDEAIALLQPTIDRPVDKPAWIVPTFLLQRANYRMLLNDPKAAEDVRRVTGESGDGEVAQGGAAGRAND